MNHSGEQTQRRSVARSLLDATLLVSLLALSFLFGCFKQKDADIWWHLKAGQIILERHELPSKDWFTFTRRDQDWIDLHWLFQVAAARLHSMGGMELLTVASAALGTLAIGIQLLARHPAASVPSAVACWFPFLFLLSGRLYVRPEVITLLCLSFYLAVFFHADRHPRWLYALVPAQILWVNVQGLFILGLVLAGIYWLDGVWQHLRRQPTARMGFRTLLVLVLTGVSLINPYGLRGLLFPIELFRKMSWDAAFYSQRIGELQSIPQFIAQSGYRQFYVLAHFTLLAFAVASLLACWSVARFNAFRTLTLAVFAWLSFQATRNSGQFAIVAGAITAWNIGEWLAARRESRAGGPSQEAARATASASGLSSHDLVTTSIASRYGPTIGCVALQFVLLASCVAVANGRFYQMAGEGRLFGLGEHPLWHAHDAAQFAAQPGMPERMLAFHLGQAAVFEFHKRDDQRTYCDPRLEVVSRELLGEYHDIEAAIAQDSPSWQAMLKRHGLQMILVDHESHHTIDATLLSTPDWRCVYFDAIGAVYLHRDAITERDLVPVRFATRLFRPADPNQLATGAVPADSNPAAGEPDPRFHQATALYRIGRSLLERSSLDWQLARTILLLAARQANDAMPQNPHELDRLRGQIYFALYPLTGRELRRDEVADFTWNTATMLDLARAHYFLGRAQQRNPDDLITLAHLYSVAKLQLDQKSQLQLGTDLLQRVARTPAQRELHAAVSKELETINLPTPQDLIEDVHRLDLDQLRQLTARQLAAGRPDLARADLFVYRLSTRQLPWDLAERLGSLCMFLDTPGIGLEPAGIAGEFDESRARSLRGSAQLVVNSLRSSIGEFQAALELRENDAETCFGLARAYLELGDASNAYAYCQRALNLPETTDDQRHGLEWMAELARPFVTENEE